MAETELRAEGVERLEAPSTPLISAHPAQAEELVTDSKRSGPIRGQAENLLGSWSERGRRSLGTALSSVPRK